MRAEDESRPVVSVVVATRNRAALLQRLLASLRRQALPADRFELIVVDDGSEDETASLLEAMRDGAGPRLQVFSRQTRGGPAVARNQGWRAARAPLVAFTDDDCEVAREWLQEILAAASADGDSAIQGQTLSRPEERDAVGPFSRVLEVTNLGPHYQTCNIAYPKEWLEELGGFDERYPLPGGEDTDLAWRALKTGHRFVFAPRAVVYHGIVDYGPVGKLRWGLHWAESMRVFADHPELRRELLLGVFWKKPHALLALALGGVIAARWFRPALLLALPYARELRGRCLGGGYSLAWMPYLALYDCLETSAAVTGSLRHRTLVI